MKRISTISAVLFFILSLISLGNVLADEAGPSITNSGQTRANLADVWDAYGLWSGSPEPWNFIWTITQSGFQIHIESSSGSSWDGITWNDVVLMRLDFGCYPIYYGKVISGGLTMGGLMWCTDGSGGWGRWGAYRMVDGADTDEDQTSHEGATEGGP
jgi:hypothetical protein